MTRRLFKSVGLAATLCAAALFTTAASAQTSFSAVYSGAGVAGGGCTSTYNISGMEPADTATHPVFVYMVGTAENYTNAAEMEAVRRMAGKGYVAATIEYASSQFGDCTVIGAKAACVFSPSNAASAISQLCSRAKADCSKGFVVAGFSQGSIMAILAKNFDARVQAAYAIGAGVQYSVFNLRRRLRISNGASCSNAT